MIFDRILVADWSARAKPSGATRREDALWLAESGTRPVLPAHHRDRYSMFEDIKSRIAQALTNGERMLVGFDFGFGYPSPFTGLVASNRADLWRQIDEGLGPDAINSGHKGRVVEDWLKKLGKSRFWVVQQQKAFPTVGGSKDRIDDARYPEWRLTESKPLDVKAPSSAFKLTGAGSVGAQILTGIPYLRRLQLAFPGRVHVWPFDTSWEVSDGQIILVEVYPSLLKQVYSGDTGHRGPWVFDAMQVDVLAEAFWKLDQAKGLGALFGQPDCLTAGEAKVAQDEEGWIFGAGHSASLEKAFRQ